MDELTAALELVLRDLGRSAGLELEIRDEAWLDQENTSSVYLTPTGGTPVGVSIDLGRPPVERLVAMADQVQDIVVEALPALGLPSNWPVCPVHPDSHPLSPVERAGRGIWVCPATGAEQSEIGKA